jgi:hypothetical protein
MKAWGCDRQCYLQLSINFNSEPPQLSHITLELRTFWFHARLIHEEEVEVNLKQ